MLGPQDIGHRVVVRRLAGHRAGRPIFTDVLGVLTTFTDAELAIVTGSGPVTIPRTSVVAGKRIPPRPPHRAPRRPSPPAGQPD